MSRQEPWQSVVHFYDTHPINETQILQTLRSKGIPVETLTEDILQAYDQDHYGGVEALDTLACKAGIQATSSVLDVCCGIGGPARYLSHRYGCRVMGLDITESRIQSALRFAHLVKLDHLVDFRHGNALAMPFASDTFDMVIGQEAWVHVPEKARLIAEYARVVKEGGVIAFTDVLRQGPLGPSALERLQRDMAFATLETLEGYSQLLTKAGCTVLEREDLSEQWATILVHRLEMYRSLQEETVAKFGEAHYRKWDDAYSFFVELFAIKQLGGGRFIARRDTPSQTRHSGQA